jgi:hypothetical protein
MGKINVIDEDHYTIEPDIIPCPEGEAVFMVQGSVPEPYTVHITFEPFTISCTCQAGQNGLPCKHRIHLLKGYCMSPVGVPPNHEAVLHKIREVADSSNIFKLLDEYDLIKDQLKNANEVSEKSFKKYRSELTLHALGKVKSDKKAT